MLQLYRDKYSTVRTIEAILTDHLDGKLCALPPSHTRHRMATRLLLDRKMLELVRDGSCTRITERGRDVLAGLLAEHAETLLAADLASKPRRQYPWGDGEISQPAEIRTSRLAAAQPVAAGQNNPVSEERAYPSA